MKGEGNKKNMDFAPLLLREKGLGDDGNLYLNN